MCLIICELFVVFALKSMFVIEKCLLSFGGMRIGIDIFLCVVFDINKHEVSMI